MHSIVNKTKTIYSVLKVDAFFAYFVVCGFASRHGNPFQPVQLVANFTPLRIKVKSLQKIHFARMMLSFYKDNRIK